MSSMKPFPADVQDRGEAEVSDRALVPRWVAPLFLALTVVLLPWVVYLALSLPRTDVAHHYRVAWVGFDLLLVGAMARTAWLAMRGSRQLQVPAAVTATLLVVDSWFDITTSGSKTQQMEAILLALFVELPIAALAVYVARVAARRSPEPSDRMAGQWKAKNPRE